MIFSLITDQWQLCLVCIVLILRRGQYGNPTDYFSKYWNAYERGRQHCTKLILGLVLRKRIFLFGAILCAFPFKVFFIKSAIMRTIVQYVYQTNADLMRILNHLKKFENVIDKTVFDFCHYYHFFGVKLLSNLFQGFTTSTKSELFDTQM